MIETRACLIRYIYGVDIWTIVMKRKMQVAQPSLTGCLWLALISPISKHRHRRPGFVYGASNVWITSFGHDSESSPRGFLSCAMVNNNLLTSSSFIGDSKDVPFCFQHRHFMLNSVHCNSNIPFKHSALSRTSVHSNFKLQSAFYVHFFSCFHGKQVASVCHVQ